MSRADKGNILVFDIGGTTSRCGIYCSETNSVNRVHRILTQNHYILQESSGMDILKQLIDTISSLGDIVLNEELPKIVSLAFPGPVDAQGNVFAAPTIWGDRNLNPINLKDKLRDIWPSSKILVLNDVTAAGYRYLQRKSEDMCIVTVSSGIGSKIFINGQPMLGSRGKGGEIGHLRVETSLNAPICDCGGLGHLGSVASGRASSFQAQCLFEENPGAFISSALGKYLKGDVKCIDNQTIVEFYKREDHWVAELVRRIAQPLGQVIACINLSIGIERFVIIGGFAFALGEGYRKELVNSAAACAWSSSEEWNSMIELGNSDDCNGLIGAGQYAILHT